MEGIFPGLTNGEMKASFLPEENYAMGLVLFSLARVVELFMTAEIFCFRFLHFLRFPL